MPPARIPKPPVGLGPAGQKLWRDLHAQFELSDGHQLHLLAAACRTCDDLVAFEARLAADGPFTLDRFNQVRSHPAVPAIRDARGLLARLLRELGLPSEGTSDTRPATALRGRYVSRP